ncbi:ABC transporter permease [Streptomyces sp. SW4]|nr:ABC transporter permease [Streptomyces sp. SW4]
MTGFGGTTGFVLLRARAHRLLVAAALLTVLLTTAVLATLTAYAGTIGDAALRHALREPRTAADAALVVEADVPEERRAEADAVVREGAERIFGGLPVTVRTLKRSGPYALPAGPSPRTAEPSDDPDLTYFAELDAGQVRLTGGRMPRARQDGVVEAAFPAGAAERLGVAPGARLTLADRLDGPAVRVTVTGLYRPAQDTAAYWRLDDLEGRGVKKGAFTTYGPLLAAPGVVTGGTVSTGASGWLASADYASLTAGRTAALRESARDGTAWLRGRPVLGGATTAATGLPEILDRLDRSLAVSRSTVLVVAVQLALLAGCALLLVARLLSAERAGELRLLRARGASRARLAGMSALEALLLAVPALVCAPLLAGPLTRLLAGQGPLERIGLRWEVPGGGSPEVWLAAAVAALGCTLAVTLPALTASLAAGGRARPLPAPLRAGADVGLLVVAGLAYWQLDRQTSGTAASAGPGGSGAGGADTGALGADPLLVAAPALALLAGTVLTLRLLPPVARLAERRAAGGRGLAAALAGWQLSRRPTRGAGPVLLLVLAVALGMLAIGQGASWERSQDDQADFRAGAPVRVLSDGEAEPGRTGTYAAVPGVREIAPAARSQLTLSGDRTATVLALDTSRAADALLLRPDLADRPVGPLLSGLAPKGAPAGVGVPAGTARLALTAALRSSVRDSAMTASVTVTVQDRYGIPYRLPAGELPADGREHALSVGVTGGPLTLTGVELLTLQPQDRAERHRLTVSGVTATAADGTVRRLPLGGAWTASGDSDGQESAPDEEAAPTEPRIRSSAPPSVEYGTGYTPADAWLRSTLTVRLGVTQPAPPPVPAVATDRFLASAGARVGQRLDVALGGETVRVRIAHAVRELPTTAPATPSAKDGGALLVDLRAVNRVLQDRYGAALTPTEWWLRPAPGETDEVVAALRAFPDVDPARVVVRGELAGQLRDDPFGAGPEAAFASAAGVAAALAAVGFAVSAAGSLRERSAEFAVLRALGAPRRRLARAVAAEQGVLVGLALLVGTALGAVLARAVIPLIVLTPQATRPVPDVHVALPAGQVAVLLAAVAATPLLVTVVLAARRPDPVTALREQGGEGR